MSVLIKKRATKSLKGIRQLLAKASKGKSLGDKGSDMFLDDAAELVQYYEQVSKGKFKKAYKLQSEVMDTATYDLIEPSVFYFIEELNNKELENEGQE